MQQTQVILGNRTANGHFTRLVDPLRDSQPMHRSGLKLSEWRS